MLLRDWVPPGVDEAAYVKAGFLKAIAGVPGWSSDWASVCSADNVSLAMAVNLG